VIGDQNSEPSSGETNAVNFNSTHPISRELDSLLDAVDSESIADEFDIGKHSKTHDFDNHLTVAVREGLDPSTSLAELADKTDTDTDEQFQAMAASTFSRYTNDRDYRAVVRFLFEVLHTPQLYHQVLSNENDSSGLLAVLLLSTRQTSNSLARSSSLTSSSEIINNPTKSTRKTEALSLTVPHAWMVNTSIRLVQLSQKAILTRARSLTTSKMMSRSSQTSTQLSGYLTVDTRTTSGSVR